MDRNSFKLISVAGAAIVALTACGKKDEVVPVTTVAPVAPVKKVEHLEEAGKSTVTVLAGQSAKVEPLPQVEAMESIPTPAELEKTYLANPDFTERVQVIFQLSNLDTADGVVVLGRVFHKEQDPDLRIQILNSLFGIEGQDDKKAVLLAAGAATNQPKEVREAAIDALGDIEVKRALPILQVLLSDTDEDIREHAKDIIEQVQTKEAIQQQ